MSFLGLKKASPVAVERATVADSAEVTALRGEITALRRSQAVIEFSLDGTILDANENFLAVTGYTLDEIRGQHHRMFVDPAEAAKPEYREFWNRLGRGEFDAGEYRRFGKDRREIWIQATYNPLTDDNGRVTKIVKYASDITATKRETAELTGRVDAIGRSQAVIEFELGGTVLHANDNFLKTLGYSLHEVVGKHHRMFVSPELAASEEYGEFWNRLGRGEFEADRYQRFGKRGREVWIQATYNPIFDASGRPMKVVKIATDITAQIENSRKAALVGNTVASSVTEMVATIDEIAKNVSRTANLAREAEGVANQTGCDIAALGDSSRKIGEVVGVIQELADQTNLLALNATIEAARAGESGRSFAVVASEVKELASATAKATENIELSVRQIQECINKVVESTQRITTGIAEVSINTTTVAAAIEEQSATMAGLGETANQLQTLGAV